jgi:hypothetical protein
MTSSLQENIMKPTQLGAPLLMKSTQLDALLLTEGFPMIPRAQQKILWFQRRFGRSHMTNKTNKPPSFVDTLYISLYQTLYPDRVKRKSTSHGLSESAGHLMVESLHTHENYLMCSCTTIWKGFYLVWWSCFSSSCASLGLVAIFKCC